MLARFRIVLSLCLLIAVLGAGRGSDDDNPLDATLTVMTYNVYLGADTGGLFQKLAGGAQPQQLLSDAGALYEQARGEDCFLAARRIHCQVHRGV